VRWGAPEIRSQTSSLTTRKAQPPHERDQWAFALVRALEASPKLVVRDRV
jgi:hypothetical protein